MKKLFSTIGLCLACISAWAAGEPVQRNSVTTNTDTFTTLTATNFVALGTITATTAGAIGGVGFTNNTVTGTFTGNGAGVTNLQPFPMFVKTLFMWDGDSELHDYSGGNGIGGYGAPLATLFPSVWVMNPTVTNFATGGYATADILAQYSTNGHLVARGGFYIVNGGLNDGGLTVAQSIANLSNLWLTARADGRKIIAIDCDTNWPGSGSGGFNPNIGALNAAIATNAVNYDLEIHLQNAVLAQDSYDGIHYSLEGRFKRANYLAQQMGFATTNLPNTTTTFVPELTIAGAGAPAPIGVWLADNFINGTTWLDISGKGFNLTNTVASSPVITPYGMNGYKEITFDGSHPLFCPQFTNGTTATYFFVLSSTNVGTSYIMDGDNNVNARHTFYVSGATFNIFAGNGVASINQLTNKWTIFTCVLNGAASAIYTNDASGKPVAGAVGDTGSGTCQGMTLSQNYGNNSSGASFGLAEVLAYPGAFTLTQLTNVYKFLTAKFSVTNAPYGNLQLPNLAGVVTNVTFNLTGTASGSDGSTVTNIPSTNVVFQLVQTNFVSGFVYTNFYGVPLGVNCNVRLTYAAVAGDASVDLQTNGVMACRLGSQTTASTVATTNEVSLSWIVPVGATYSISNGITAGAGDAVLILAGQLLVY